MKDSIVSLSTEGYFIVLSSTFLYISSLVVV
jgi:hypothetical protein